MITSSVLYCDVCPILLLLYCHNLKAELYKYTLRVGLWHKGYSGLAACILPVCLYITILCLLLGSYFCLEHECEVIIII